VSPADARALIVVDVQRGFDDAAYWGPRNNPACEANVAALIAAWRAWAQPIVFVRHDSTTPSSPLAPGQPGNGFVDAITGEPDLLVAKQVNSAFYGTPDLHAWLGEHGIGRIAVCGITTNHCCETTARMAGNLGYETTFVLDATHTFDRVGPGGIVLTADELARATATNLDGEFARVLDTAEVIARG
jgi:nicotinamidase-related amidase